MTTTRYFKSTDAGAPVLSGEVGSFYALIKALLVGNSSGIAYGTGAGEKEAAGWELAFDDPANNRCVLRNSFALGGTGFCLYVEDNGATAGAAREAKMVGYSSMTSVSEGSDPTGTVYVRKSGALSGDSRAWAVVADERGWWGQFQYNNGSAFRDGMPAGAGDIDSFLPANPYRYYVTGGTGNTNTDHYLIRNYLSNSVGSPTSWSSAGSVFGGNQNAVAGATWGGVRPLLHSTAGADHINGAIGSRAAAGDSVQLSGLLHFIPAHCWMGNQLVGRFRGLYAPVCNVVGRPALAEYPALLGRPPESILMTLRGSAQGTGNGQESQYEGHLYVEAVLDW